MAESTPNVDRVRRKALDAIDRSQKYFMWSIVATAVCELTFLVWLILIVDFKDNLHQILVVVTCLIYGTLGWGLFSLGVFIQKCTLRILKAIEINCEESVPLD